MPYDSIIDRTDAAALIPEDVSREIIQALPAASFSLGKFRRATMSRKQQRMPVLSAFPVAYWVDGDTGLKQTADQAWGNKYLNAEELAVIVPIPQSVLDDSDFDIWGEVRPRLVEAIGKSVDSAVLFGVNKPASFPDGILPGVKAASHYLEASGGATPAQDFAADVNDMMGLVEADGFDVNGFAANVTVKAKLRGLRDEQGGLLFQPSLQAGTPGSLYGESITFVKNGSWDGRPHPDGALIIGGDWSQGIIAVRQDLNYKLLSEAVIQGADGAIIYNLAQQDMVALRVTFRVAFQVANPITQLNSNDTTRYPWAAIGAYSA